MCGQLSGGGGSFVSYSVFFFTRISTGSGLGAVFGRGGSAPPLHRVGSGSKGFCTIITSPPGDFPTKRSLEEGQGQVASNPPQLGQSYHVSSQHNISLVCWSSRISREV